MNTPKTSWIFLLPLMAGLALGLAGCGPRHRPSETNAGQHKDLPPHGGTAVTLGDDAFHVEFVRDADAGKLSAYVLDDEMEEFVRGGSPGFTVVAKVGGEERPLDFKPVADPATGETLTSTSLYEASAPWLKTTAAFDAVIRRLSVHDQVFADVSFNFPKGEGKD